VTTTASVIRRGRLTAAFAGVAVAAMSVVAILGLRAGDSQPEVSVYPSHSTLAASPETHITVRGAAADELDDIEITGSRSGRHTGRWESHPDGEGAEFVPQRAFAPGERVTVDTGMHVAGTQGDGSTFVVARRSPVPTTRYDQAKPARDRKVQVFASRPDLRPPAITVQTASRTARPGNIFVAPKRGATQQGPMILDEAGRLVWFRPLPGDDQAFDFRAQTYRGTAVLTWWQGRMARYRGAGVGHIVDSFYRPVATVRAANGYELDAHEFKLTPSGTALVMSYVVVPWDLSKLGGRRDGLVEDNVVQEIDIETGALLFEWHALGSIGLGESYRPAPRARNKIHDPYHLNSIDLDADGNLVLSARHTNAIYTVDRRTANVIWRLGGKRSDFAMRPGTTFKLQHDARVQPDGTITLFDNVAEDLPARGRRSRGLTLAVDRERRTASLVHELEHPDGILSPTQGSMQRLGGGAAFIGWGGLQPVFSEFDPNGRLVFDARFVTAGVETYRAYRMPWSATPAQTPRAVATATRGITTVRVSWNGATEVARWRVRAVRTGTTATAARRGFETTLRLNGRPREVVVDALDASGTLLGTTAPVAVRSPRD
jgi:Arylsulfotransferase (ASST)